jgi:U3 small nucleolar RNA-associated protein 7
MADPNPNTEDRANQLRIAEARKKYGRGKRVNIGSVKDKKLRSNLKRLESKYKEAALQAQDAEILLENQGGYLEPEGELERTYKVRQDELQKDVSIETAKKGFELKLDGLGPYVADYTRNGRKLLLTGRKGHVATMDWRGGALGCELQLGETVRDAKWLHNDQFFAVAQKKYVYIYDHAGVEIHCLKKHVEVTHLEFLPYHFLLASAVSLASHSLRLHSNPQNRPHQASSATTTPQPATSSPNTLPALALPPLSLKIPTTPSSTSATKTAP